MKIRQEYEFLFSQERARKWLRRPRGPRPNALLPLTMRPDAEVSPENYLFSLDPRCLALTEWLRERLNKEFPTDVLPTGFAGPTAVPGSFDALTAVSGYGQDPLPIPISDNAQFVASQGVEAKIREADLPWLEELVRLFFGAAVPADLHIRKAASTGFPFFTNDVSYKKQGAMSAIQNCDVFLGLLSGPGADFKLALERFHAIYCYAIQERQQPDSTVVKDGVERGKDRAAPTEREAREGTYSGRTFADKTVRDEFGNVIPGHFAMRRRDVFGLNGILNYFLTAVMASFRGVYLNRFAFTYKTRGSADKEEKIKRYRYTVGCDVKTMDKLIPEDFSVQVFRLLHKYLDERVIEVMRRAYKATYVAPSPWRETPADYDPVFGGHPLSPDGQINHVGLPSGIAFNPDWGKLWMTFVYAILYRDVGALRSPADLELWLQGKNPDHALLDMSDDAAFLTNSQVIADRLAKPKSPYAVLEPETPVLFLGDVFCEVGGTKRAFPNPVTYIVNALCREDSIIRPRDTMAAWATSYVARDLVYSRTPIYRDLSALYDEGCRKHLGIRPSVIARAFASLPRLNDVDAMVKADPNTLYYKVDPSTVSPSVLDDVVSTIPAADIWGHLRHLFKVPTVDYEEIHNGK